jgi:hypothetical protein
LVLFGLDTRNSFVKLSKKSGFPLFTGAAENFEPKKIAKCGGFFSVFSFFPPDAQQTLF